MSLTIENEQIQAFDEPSVQQAQSYIDRHAPDGIVRDLADMFAAFADVTRVRLLCALAQGELCVGDLALILGVSPSAVSHQLRGLRALRLVKYRREGKMMFYSLDDEHVLTLLDVGLAHAKESQPK